MEDVKIFETYIQKRLYKSTHGGVRSHHRTRSKMRFWLVSVHFLIVPLKSELMPATAMARCISVRAYSR